MIKGIRGQLLNRGMLFLQFPEMMLFESKQNSTESSYLLKMSKLVGNKPDRKHDDHTLRKIREDGLNEETTKLLFGDEMASKNKSLINSCTKNDFKNVGGWVTLFGAIKNLTLNKDDCLKPYTDFLLNLCEIDKNYIAVVSKKDPENKHDIEEVNQEFQKWLLLPSINLNSSNEVDDWARLIIALILHWTALFEHFLLIEYEQHEDTLPFTNYLPKFNKKDNLECSNDVFLTRFKNRWAKEKYKKKSITWTTFYKDIERAKNKKRPDYETFRVNPNTDKIKKTLTRWRNGKEGFLSIEAIKKELHVLYQPYDPEDFDFKFFIIVFVQLFDSIQRELQKEGFSDEFIIEQFSRYSEYFELVKKRFKQFKKTGAIEP